MILPSLIIHSGHRIFFPFYHAVDDQKQIHIQHLYPVKTVQQFENELDSLLNIFEPLHIDDLMTYHQIGSLPAKPSMFLSFDDGLRQCHEVIAPILKKKGIPATFFINTAFVDNQDLMYRYKVSLLIENGLLNISSQKDLNYNHLEKIDAMDKEGIFDSFLENHQPYMSMSQIKNLEQQGFTFGAHSHSHPFFKDIPLEKQIEEVSNSTALIDEHLNQKHKLFAFPFDDVGVSNALFEAVKDKVDVFFSTGGIKADEREDVYRRTTMEEQNNTYRYLLKRYGLASLKRILSIKHIHRR